MKSQATSNSPALIYDFDGTLVDSLPIMTQIFNQLKAEYGYDQVSSEQIKKDLLQKNTAQLIKEYELSVFKLPNFIKQIQQEFGKRIDQLNWQPGMQAVIKDFAQKEVGQSILTSNSVQNVTTFLKQNKSNVFKFIQSSKNLFGKDKTIASFLKKQKLTKQQAIYIGDETRDVEACKKIGVKIIAVSWGIESRTLLNQAEPDFLIDKPQQINEIINRL